MKQRQRLSAREQGETLPLPNLVEIQLRSFEEFLQANALPHERLAKGLQQVFLEIFPIVSYDNRISLEFVSYRLSLPRYLPDECLSRGITYYANLLVRIRLTDEQGTIEEEVYMGNMPLMTPQGTFIINGAERVIISQLHRSPGICFESHPYPGGQTIYSMRIIPYRGNWLEAAFDNSDLLHIYVDRRRRKRKLLASTFLRTLGFSSDADILKEFFQTKEVMLGESDTFPQFLGAILAEDVSIGDEKLGKAGEKLSTAMLKQISDRYRAPIRLLVDADDNSPVLKMLAKDLTNSYEGALKEFYRRLHPGEPATLANARTAMIRLFFDPKRYDLGDVGRYKLNEKIYGGNQEVTDKILRRDDIVAALKYLLLLKEGHAEVDDIDHLWNRRVRCAGELIQNQCRLGLTRIEKIVRERISLIESNDRLTPSKIISAKGLSTVLRDFFSRSQLSQFMDQTNPVAELTHKRRLSSLGPGGLNRERAGFEVRDVHPSHYGRICPIETPEGANIGLITSLSTYAKINDLGFIETPYQVVNRGSITSEVEYMTAADEEKCVIAQASARDGEHIGEGTPWARYKQEQLRVERERITHIDVSPKQLVSVAAGLIPFLEHDDANRALMGSNMQRQAVPLLETEAPLVGTGMEGKIARDSGALVIAEEGGIVSGIEANRIEVTSEKGKKTHQLKTFRRSNSGTCIHQKPLCHLGERVEMGDILADGAATERGEVALGKNTLVAFMPWGGYNYEDAIIISEKLVRNDTYMSIYIEEFEANARYTKLGAEEITRDIPNASEEALSKLGDDGIITVGSHISAGDILVGKIAPKVENELSPEERLLRVIFGEQAADVRDASLIVPPGTEGVVMDVHVFRRHDGKEKSEERLTEEKEKIEIVKRKYEKRSAENDLNLREKLSALLLGQTLTEPLKNNDGEILINIDRKIEREDIEKIAEFHSDQLESRAVAKLLDEHRLLEQKIQLERKMEIDSIRKGDVELDPGILCQVKILVACKRRLQVGDKMAGRHGNKGVVSRIVPEEDMPCLPNGESIEIILNPLGVPSRMNIGQLLETHLGMAAKEANISVKSPVFESFPEKKIWQLLSENGLPADGKMQLYDGRNGQPFDNRVVVGYIYMLKLSHLVSDKIHARSVGPYSLVTQQPLGGKAHLGGQRFGEMEVWALEAFGAANLLREMLTVKSDDVDGRTRMYESIVKGENSLKVGAPESFNVLIKELQGLLFDIKEEKIDG